MTGIGISLGASILANYAARVGDKNPLDAQVGLCCHFSCDKAFDFMRSHLFGFYDHLLAFGMGLSLVEPIA